MQFTFEMALREWAGAIGPQFVVTDDVSLREAERGTYHSGHAIRAILRPGSRPEVQECLRIANHRQIPLYPVSSGKNWGYGSRMPAASGCVLLELGRMDRIVDFSEELGYVTVEPGVTQAQLHAFLRDRKSRLWMDATGSSPGCSLIGNTVERGFGHTPYGDHFAQSCAYEVVLPDGRVIDTGFARYPDAHAASAYRWGAGPTLDGLFSQSSFGIVTRMTIWLMPAPEYFRAYYFRCREDEDLAEVVNALRPLRMNGTLRSALHIANDYKVLGAVSQYPWTATGGQVPLAGHVRQQLRDRLKVSAWTGSGALYGTRVQVREAARLLSRALKGKAGHLRFLDDRRLHVAMTFSKLYDWVTRSSLQNTLHALQPVYDLLKGVPTTGPLASAYWRKRMPPPPEDRNPDRDGCGLLWCSPVAPLDGGHAQRVSELATELVLRHAFEPMISITMLTERALACIISIAYDRDLPGEDGRARECHRNLLRALAENGYHSYRLGVGSMDAMDDGTDYGVFLSGLKRAVDPHGILAPGRYEIPAARARAATAQ